MQEPRIKKPPGRFYVGDWLVDPASDRINAGDGWVAIRPKVMDMLVQLAEDPGRIFTVDELLSGVWPATVTSPSSVYNCLKELRSALKDDPHDPRYIRTFPKRGYRLIARVHRATQPGEEFAGKRRAGEVPARRSAAWFSRPTLAAVLVVSGLVVLMWNWQAWNNPASPVHTLDGDTQMLAVLPFRDLSAEGADRYLGDGLALAMFDDLATIPDVGLISPQSSFRFRAAGDGHEAIAAKLDADLVIDGTVLRLGGQLIIGARLMDVQSGRELWTKTLQMPADELHRARVELGESLRAALSEDQEAAALSPRMPQPTRQLDTTTYDRFLQARTLIHQGDRDSLIEALEILDQVLLAEPGFGRARARHLDAAWQLFWRHGYAWPGGEVENMAEHEEYERGLLEGGKRLALDYPMLPEAHLLLGRILRFSGEYELARASLERALEMSPSLAEGYRELGWLNYNQNGSWAVSVEHFGKAVSLDPYSVELRSALIRGLSYIAERREQMWDLIRETRQRLPWSPQISFSESVALVSEGRYADAIRVLETALGRGEDRAIRAALMEKWYALDRPDRSRQLDPRYMLWRSHPDDEPADSINRCPPRADKVTDELLLWAAYVCAALREPDMTRELLERRFGNPDRFGSDPAAMLGTEHSAAVLMAWVYRVSGDPQRAARYARIEQEVLDGLSENGTIKSSQHAMLRARVAAALGDTANVFSMLEEMLEYGRLHPLALDHPVFDEYRETPRFHALRKRRAELVQAQLARLGSEVKTFVATE